MNFKKLNKAIDEIKCSKDNVRKVADIYRLLSNISSIINKKKKELEPILLKNKVYELFPEDEQKVVYNSPKDSNFINKKRLFNFLMKNDRFKDLIKIASVTEKSVSELKDGKELIGKYKEVKGKTRDGIQVKSMTKAEIEKCAKEKGSMIK